MSPRRLTQVQRDEIDLADISRIDPKSGCELMARGAGGCENLGFAQVDYRYCL